MTAPSPAPRVDLVAAATQRSVLSVLMTAPELRGELLKRYPGRVEQFFASEPARDLLRQMMTLPGQAVPASLEPRVPHLLAGDWAPQRIYDTASPDYALRFWADVEALRALAMKREIIKVASEATREAAAADNIDVYARTLNNRIATIVSGTSRAHDPRLAAVAERYQAAKAEGRLGRRVPTGIPRLDVELGGGLRVDPGELVGIAGYEKRRKCVTGDTWIYTDQGLVQISSLFPDERPYHSTNQRVVGPAGLETASGLYANGRTPTVRLRTYHGFELEATPEHPVWVMDASGQGAWRPLSAVRPGDHLALVPGRRVFPAQEMTLPVPATDRVEVCRHCQTTRRPHAGRGLCDCCREFVRRKGELAQYPPLRGQQAAWDNQHQERVRLPEYVTPALGRWAGYLVAEGCLQANRLLFSNHNPEVAQDYLGLCQQLFGRMPRQHGIDYHLSSKPLAAWARQLGLVGRSRDKRVPDFVLSGTRATQCEFLRGYFEGDGGVSLDGQARLVKVSASSLSRDLLRQVQLMLLNFGLVARLTERQHATYPQTTVYELTLRGRFADGFMHEIGFVSRAKSPRYTAAIHPHRDLLPYQRRALVGLAQTRGQAASTAVRYLTGRGYQHLARAQVSAIQVVLGDLPPATRAAERYFWDAVTETVAGEAETYDLVMPETHAFVSNGILSHNTTLLTNIVAGWHLAGLPGGTVWICNEESMDTMDLMCQLWAMQATRLAIQRSVGSFGNQGFVPVTFSREDVAEREWNGRTGEIVQEAYALVNTWDIRLYGAGTDDGNAMDFESVYAQALAEIEFNGAKRVVIDNLQGWRVGEESDYDAMNRTVPRVAALTGLYHCLTIALSQYSREGKIRGSGGFEGRANLVLGTEYDEEKNPDWLGVTKKYGRNRGYFKIEDLRLERRSGLVVDGWYTGSLT